MSRSMIRGNCSSSVGHGHDRDAGAEHQRFAPRSTAAAPPSAASYSLKICRSPVAGATMASRSDGRSAPSARAGRERTWLERTERASPHRRLTRRPRRRCQVPKSRTNMRVRTVLSSVRPKRLVYRRSARTVRRVSSPMVPSPSPSHDSETNSWPEPGKDLDAHRSLSCPKRGVGSDCQCLRRNWQGNGGRRARRFAFAFGFA